MDVPSFFAEKQIFYRNFISETDSMAVAEKRADSNLKLSTLNPISAGHRD